MGTGEREAEGPLPLPPVGVLEKHGSAGLEPRRRQGKLGKLVNVATFASFRSALGNLVEVDESPGADDPFEGIETRDAVLPRHASISMPREQGDCRC